MRITTGMVNKFLRELAATACDTNRKPANNSIRRMVPHWLPRIPDTCSATWQTRGKYVQKNRTVTTDVWVVLCGYSLLSTGASFVAKDSRFYLHCERLAVSDSCGKWEPLQFSYELGKKRLWSDRQRRVSNWLSTPGILDQLKSKTKQQGWGLLLWRVKSQTDLFLCFTSSTLLESRGWLYSELDLIRALKDRREKLTQYKSSSPYLIG